MADQTTRLEVATVKAEDGARILYSFSNESGPIATASGDIPSLSDVISDIQDEGAEKIAFSTSIFNDTASGIAATMDQEIFLVASDDTGTIYNVYQNQAGVAVDTGKRAVSADGLDAAVAQAMQASDAATEAAAEAIEQSSRFLPPSDTDYTVRPDGSALQFGDQYLNTSTNPNQARMYGSSGWFTPNPDAANLQPQIDELRSDVDSLDDDAAQLATNLANLSSRTGQLEARPRALGDGQTWQNLTSQRAINTSYTNSSGRTRFVMADSTPAVSNENFRFQVDGQDLPQWGFAGTNATRAVAIAIVPAGSLYRLTGRPFSTWFEI